MTAQMRAELRRVAHRRVLWVALAVVCVAVVATSVWSATSSGGEGGQSFCPSSVVTRWTGYVSDDGPLEPPCPETTPSQIPKEATADGGDRPWFPWAGSLAVAGALGLALVYVTCASLMGADFRHRVVESELVAEPRRARLLTVRLAAVVAAGVGLYLVVAIGFLLAITPALALHARPGTSLDPTAVALVVARGMLVAVLVSVLAATIAVIGRGALAPLVALVVAAGAAALALSLAEPLLGFEPLTNFWAVLTGGDGVRNVRVEVEFGVPGETFMRGVWLREAAWPWVVALAGTVGLTMTSTVVAFATFGRRDFR